MGPLCQTGEGSGGLGQPQVPQIAKLLGQARDGNQWHEPACPDSTSPPLFQLNYRDCEKAVKKYHIDGLRFLVSAGQSDPLRPKLSCTLINGCRANRATLSLGMPRDNVCLQDRHTACGLLQFCMNASLITSQDPSYLGYLPDFSPIPRYILKSRYKEESSYS